MNEKDILKIVDKLMDERLSAVSEDPFCGATIEGKEQFLTELNLQLQKLFDDNDLSK